jgi:hypothetical protein
MVISLSVASVLRGIIHFKYSHLLGINPGILEVGFDMYYLFILYFSLLFGYEFICKILLKNSIQHLKLFYSESSTVWIFIFPAVPVITILSGSVYMTEVSFFSFIPSFINGKNFLPSGMIFVSPLIFYFSVRHVLNFTSNTVLKSILCVLPILIIVYLLYYQWTFNLYLHLRRMFGSEISMSIYATILSTILFFIIKNLVNRNVLNKGWLIFAGIALYTFTFLSFVFGKNVIL